MPDRSEPPARATARREFLRYLAASPLRVPAGLDARMLERLTTTGDADDGWRLLEEVGRIAQVPALIPSPNDALSVFDFEPVAKAKLPPAHFGDMASGGVEAVLAIMRRELVLSMKQVWVTSLKQLGRQYVLPRAPLAT